MRPRTALEFIWRSFLRSAFSAPRPRRAEDPGFDVRPVIPSRTPNERSKIAPISRRAAIGERLHERMNARERPCLSGTDGWRGIDAPERLIGEVHVIEVDPRDRHA